MSAAAVDETTAADQLEQLSVRVRELAVEVSNLEAGRRHPMDGRELVNHERRLAIKRRQLTDAETDLDKLAADLLQADEAERARRERARAAARPKLERRQARLTKHLTEQLLEIERIAPELVDAVAAALTTDAELHDVEYQLGERRSGNGPSGWRLAIENRLGFLLCGGTSPLDRIERPLGRTAHTPLASLEPPPTCTVCAHPRRREIETATTSVRATAKAFGVSRSAIGRHKKNHLPGG